MLRVKNWERFQHYKHRSPPWIKLHREVLNDFAFQSLNDAARSHLMLIWALAAGSDGVVPASAKFIAARIGASGPIDLDAIVETGLLEAIDDGKPQIESEPRPKREKQARGKRTLPADWQPSAELLAALGTEYNWKNGDADKYASAFRDACAAKGYQYADFDAAFRNCVRADWPKLRAPGQSGSALSDRYNPRKAQM